MRTMYDSVTASNIPKDAEMAAGYINGRYKWSQQDWQCFPHAVLIRIQVYIPGQDVFDDGDVLDVEANDAPSARGPASVWVRMRQAYGLRPCIYTSLSTKDYLLFNNCDYWLADYWNSRQPHMLPQVVATQYANPGPYDLSLVRDDWHPTTVAPPAPPVPPIIGAHYMILNITLLGTDGQGNGYVDMANVDIARVVTANVNTQDPKTQGYPKYPTFKGGLQLGSVARLVFEDGAPNLGSMGVRVVIEKD